MAGAAMRERLRDALEVELGDALDCSRVWSAWGYGTMREDDFVPVNDRLDEIVDGVLVAISPSFQEGSIEWSNEALRAARDAVGSTLTLREWLKSDGAVFLKGVEALRLAALNAKAEEHPA